jgi:dTDP-4-dehydrorhamnose 3,5-epimerase-like enzyme
MMHASLIPLRAFSDDRGLLVAGQYPDELPFIPVRTFIVSQGPAGIERGGHAHRRSHQVLIAVSGRVHVEWDDALGTQEIVLISPIEGLHIPPLVWARQIYLDTGSTLVVLASHTYDGEDYIDDRGHAALLRNETAQVGRNEAPT